MTMALAKEELEKIKERDGELTYRAGKTHEYLLGFKLDAKKSEELVKKIEELNIPRLKPEHVVKLVDLMPTTIEELKVILQGTTVTVSNDNLQKIAGILNADKNVSEQS